MLNKLLISGILSIFCCFSLIAQNKNKKNKSELLENIVIKDTLKVTEPINTLAPAKAAFYEAILPGLGHAYNKKYWHIPIVYAVLGTEISIYVYNNNQYNRYRDAYKSRLAGFETDEFYFDSNGTKLEEPSLTTDGLESAQEQFRKQKELTLLITIGTYALNIIWANVGAHLKQYNIDSNLSLTPHFEFNEIDGSNNLGLTLNFKF